MSKALIAMSVAMVFVFTAHFAAAEPKSAPYIDLTGDFARYFDETAGMDEAARVAQFHEKVGAKLPGFYAPRFGLTPERYDAKVARALKRFGELRPRYEEIQKIFPAAFEAGIQHFRKRFPGFTPNVPVYLLHSLGEMDGGTREFDGKIYLIFGADVIAGLHDPHDITAFLDHEMFHVENQKFFRECEQVWCLLWAEGLATYAAKVMNPGASDQQLLLTSPKPIRAAVDAKWPSALCFTRTRLLSTQSADMDALFVGGDSVGEFPDRFGYYVGMRIAEELGREYSLPALAHMPPQQAEKAIVSTLDRLVQATGGCR